MNRTLAGFLRKELAQALRDKRMRVVLFIMPLIQLTIFGLAISTEVRGVRLKAVYAPTDRMARRLEERCLSSGWFVPAHARGNDPFEWVQGGDADAVILVPPGGLTESFMRGRGRVQLLVDATNAVRARSVERYVQAISEEVLAEESRGKISVQRLALDVRVLYNPSMETAVFMVPGVMSLILAVTTIVLSSMSMAREREIGTFEMLVSAPVKNWEVLLGKTLPYVLLGMIDVPLIVGVAVFGFGVPVRGPLWQLLAGSLIFICTTVSIGTLISTFAKNQQQAMMGGFMVLYPFILLSGIMFPVENMPGALRGIAYLDPLKYFVTLLRNIMLKGGAPRVFLENAGALVAIGAASAWLSFRRFKQTLN